MVRIADWFLLGACTLFSATYALPQPAVTPAAIFERAADDKTKIVTRTSTGRGGRIRTFTTTRTIGKTTTHVRSTRTRPITTVTKTTTTTGQPTTIRTKTKTTVITTQKPTKTTSTTTHGPTYTGTPGTCPYYASAGPEYTTSQGVTFDIDCGALIIGIPYTTVTTSSYGACLSLCAANTDCVAFHWDYPVLLLPGQCFLFDVSVATSPSFISDAGVVVSR